MSLNTWNHRNKKDYFHTTGFRKEEKDADEK